MNYSKNKYKMLSWKTTTLALALISVAIISCSKDDDSNEKEPVDQQQQPILSFPDSKEEAASFLHATNEKSWATKSFNISVFGAQSCRNDDTMQINADGTYNYNNGAVLCGGGDVASKNGTWELDFENRQLIFDKGTDNEVIAEVEDLTETSMKVTGNWSVYQISGTYQPQ